MREYIFALKYRVPATSSPDDLVERLGGAGLTDALPGIGTAGRLALEFTREGDNAHEVIAGAIEDVAACLPEAMLIEATPDFVGLSDVADILDLSRQALRKMMNAYSDFPMPVHDGSTAIWHLADILAWLQGKRGYKIDPILMSVAAASRQINADLESVRLSDGRRRRYNPAEVLEGADAPKTRREDLSEGLKFMPFGSEVS